MMFEAFVHSLGLSSEDSDYLARTFVEDCILGKCLVRLNAMLKFATGSVAGHDAEHAARVFLHADRAAKANSNPLSPSQLRIIRVGALLHDADDSKVFTRDSSATHKYPNARSIIWWAFHSDAAASSEPSVGADPAHAVSLVIPESSVMEDGGKVVDFVAQVENVISLVSTSANGTSSPEGTEPWQLIVRHADRLEAIGVVGLQRCYEYTVAVQRPIAVTGTWRARDVDDLYTRVAPKVRFDVYCGKVSPDVFPGASGSGKSPTMMDHVYDKLLHISGEDSFPPAGENPYLCSAARERHSAVERLALSFGATGVVDPAAFGCNGPVVSV